MIKAVELSKTYGSGLHPVKALRGVSLDIAEGDFVAIAGPSGCGKTTFLNIVGGLDQACSGCVLIDGVDLSGLSAAALCRLRREKLGFVFQSYNLIPVLTARENVEFGLLIRGTDPILVAELAADALERVGLAEMCDRRPAELSGGQQQRAAVARAIAGSPQLVIADEPTANLDSTTAQELVDLLERLNGECGVTFLFSSHDSLVLNRARRVVRFRDGQIEH